MLRPTLLYLYEQRPTSVDIWPEVRDVAYVYIPSAHPQDDTVGRLPRDVARAIISVPEGSEGAMRLLQSEANDWDFRLITVRRAPAGLHRPWWMDLECVLEGTALEACDHSRTAVCAALALQEYRAAVRSLDDAVQLLRGNGIPPSAEAMRTEKSLTKALEVLRSSGFTLPT